MVFRIHHLQWRQAVKHEHAPVLVRRDGSAVEDVPLKVMYPEDHAALPRKYPEDHAALPRKALKNRQFATSPIPGHCALSTMIELQVEEASGAKQKLGIEDCTHVFMKARDITQVYIDHRLEIARNSSVPDHDVSDSGWVGQLLQRILTQTKG